MYSWRGYEGNKVDQQEMETCASQTFPATHLLFTICIPRLISVILIYKHKHLLEGRFLPVWKLKYAFH